MKKYLALFLAAIMMLSSLGMAAFAEEPAPTEEAQPTPQQVAGSAGASLTPEEQAAQDAEIAYMQSSCEFEIIEANGEQPRLTYQKGTAILDVDGFKFKDLNKNGKLDVYEDWRVETDKRVEDVIAQMTDEELVGLLFCVQAYEQSCRENITSFKNNCQLFNLNGSPEIVTNIANHAQAACEAERLGVPMVMASDREYNAFGGYIDKAHEAFGTAYDPELAYQLALIYGAAMDAVGIHVTFEPYAEEIGAQYGENPELISKVAYAEIKGLEDSGFSSCTKHWIGRGGDSSFGGARSVAQNFDNWMVGWQAALDAGCEWIMTNCGGTGITNTTDVKWDKVTMSYLRDTLGFDGVVVTDWWALGMGSKISGVTNEGIELSEQSAAWLYNDALLNGTTIFGGGSLNHGTEITAWMALWPDVIIEGLKTGEVERANVVKEATRALRFKFTKGLFENPYRVVSEALDIVASAEYIANPWPITTNEELRAARSPKEVELTEKLQAKSAVLVKNDNNILPLQKGVKVYIETSSADTKAGYAKYIANYAAIVESMEEADVVIGDFTAVNDAAELFLDDAKDYGKTVVLTLNNTDPTQYAIESADALIYMSYNHRADHGSTEAGFITTTEPWVYADILFGEKAPGGVIVKEIARDALNDDLQWKDLAGDQGASPYVRLMVQAVMEDDKEYHASPNNWGDPLVQAYYGMAYGAQPEFKYSCLILPMEQRSHEEKDSSGNMSTVVESVETAKAGVPFTVYCLLRNNGADGIVTVPVYDNGTLIAEKIMTVCGGSWRVVQIDITLDTVGEHAITVGDTTGSLTIYE